MSGTPHDQGGEALLVAEHVQKVCRTPGRPAPGRRTDDHHDSGHDREALAIEVDSLVKTYETVRAVDRESLTVGEFFGILGPNRAGKTTLLELIEGCANPTPARSACSANRPGRATPGCCRGSACSCRPASSSTSSARVSSWRPSARSTAPRRPAPPSCWRWSV